MTSDLALLGGSPVVTANAEFSWPPRLKSAEDRILAMLTEGELSYYGREGEVEHLEESWKQFLGAPYALAVSSGTAALHSAYFGIGLQPGDEVIAPTFTFLATVMPIFVVNSVPVLVDAEADTGNIDCRLLEAHVTSRTRAIVITHMYGHACNMDAITSFARQHDLALIEDCSHAHGAEYKGKRLGTFGDVAIFSLQSSKLVAAGQGGVLVTLHQEIYERANLLGHFRVRSFQEVRTERYKQFSSTGYGLNYRMHPFAAALANKHFEQLNSYINGRCTNLTYLSQRLKQIPGVAAPAHHSYVTRHAYYSYKPRYVSEELGGLDIGTYISALRAEGVPIAQSTSTPLHLEPLFRDSDDGSRTYGQRALMPNRRVYQEGDCPVAERHSERLLVIPPFTTPNIPLMNQLVEAFAKVADQADKLMEVRNIEPDLTRRMEDVWPSTCG